MLRSKGSENQRSGQEGKVLVAGTKRGIGRLHPGEETERSGLSACTYYNRGFAVRGMRLADVRTGSKTSKKPVDRTNSGKLSLRLLEWASRVFFPSRDW